MVAPLGGRGKGEARFTAFSAIWSSFAEPELFASDSDASLPLGAMAKLTTAVPRILVRGLLRWMRRITVPG